MPAHPGLQTTAAKGAAHIGVIAGIQFQIAPTAYRNTPVFKTQQHQHVGTGYGG